MNNDIEAKIAERLAKIGPEIGDAVVSILADREIEKRTKQVSDAFSEWDELTRKLKRVNRPDVQTFNQDGSVASESYSKGRLDEIKKIKERIDKIDTAVTSAIKDSNFEKLNNLGSSKADKSE